MKKRGVFICIEGLDASGKTTQSKRLVRSLRQMGFKAMYTAEPSLGEIGKFLRTRILHGRRRVPSVIEAVLFSTDRIDHVERRIKPALREGKIVVCDRYLFSSLAYQGAAGLDLNWIEGINRSALTPDLAIYIDVPPEVVVERIKRKRSVMETSQIQEKVREIYMRLVESGRLVRIDGNRQVDEVAKDILVVVLDFLKN